MLTLYLIESPDHLSRAEVLESFGNIPEKALTTENRNFSRIESPTEYFMLMYTAEKIDEALRDALPVFMGSGIDIFIFFKKLMLRDKGKTYMQPYVAPRLFRNTVKLCDDCIKPQSYEGFSSERILNGWIEEWRSVQQ